MMNGNASMSCVEDRVSPRTEQDVEGVRKYERRVVLMNASNFFQRQAAVTRTSYRRPLVSISREYLSNTLQDGHVES